VPRAVVEAQAQAQALALALALAAALALSVLPTTGELIDDMAEAVRTITRDAAKRAPRSGAYEGLAVSRTL